MLQRLFSKEQWEFVFFFDSIRFIISCIIIRQNYIKIHALANILVNSRLRKAYVFM